MQNINPSNLAKELTNVSGVKTYHLIANVTSYMEGEIDDWPSNIQDGIHAALERKADEVEHPLMIIFSKCDRDWGSDETNPRWYVYVLASEIVVADDRIFQDEKAKMRQLISDITTGRRTH